MQTTLGFAPRPEDLDEGYFDHPVVIFSARGEDLTDTEEEAEPGDP